MEFQQLLRFAVEHNASDVHLQAELRPGVRIGGVLKFTNQAVLTDEEVRNFVASRTLRICSPGLAGPCSASRSKRMAWRSSSNSSFTDVSTPVPTL